jgi:hypothetical protein
MLAIKPDLVVLVTIDAPFHALIYRQVLFSIEDITTPLPCAITNGVQGCFSC